jgi:ABC-type lipoprotein release transport system permease subunit
VNKFQLILRNLLYFRAANLAVVLGMAVATAVLTGALMVGDSVRESLRALAVQRLGPVDHALVATRFFEQSLVDRIGQATGGRYQLAPAVLVRGGASAAEGDARTAGVQIAAVGAPGQGEPWVTVPRRQGVVNGEVAEALGAREPGQPLLYTVAAAQDVPREATLARRGVSEVVSGGRIELARVESQPGFAAMFSLEGSQRVPRNLWLNLADLQAAVEQPKRVNAVFVADPTRQDATATVAELNGALRQAVTLADYGLSVDRDEENPEAVLNSRGTFIDPPALEAARNAARSLNAPLREVSVYLINDVTVVSGGATGAGTTQPAAGKSIHYAVGAGVSDLPGAKLADNEVALNEWAAGQLGAKRGDAIRLAYYQRDPNGNLKVVRSEPLNVAAVLPMEGLAADPTLTPAYKGLTDTDSISDWDPPEGVEIDQSKVTDEDEAYWDKYRAAPKLFVSLPTARKLWGGAYGEVTSVRVPAGHADAFGRALLAHVDPATMGLAFQPLRARQLAAASGSTDFAMLFVGFSFFLIVAAALLVAMLFQLNIEQRARQLGLMAAVGFGPRSLRGLALLEGMTLALVGGVVGLVGAVGYTWLMVAGLRSWWSGAVGTTAMRLYVEPRTLVIGLLASLFVAFLAVLWGVWRVGRTPEARLLAGGWNDPSQAKRRTGQWASRLGVAGGALGLILLAVGGLKPAFAQGAFIGGGAVLMASSLLWLSGQLRIKPSAAVVGGGSAAIPGATSLRGLGFRNAARHTARSVLSVGLIAFAAFTLVTVASLKQGEPQDTHERNSGAGGYRLILQSGIPLTSDLSSPTGRELLGVGEPRDALWDRVSFVSMRQWAGQDVSCLNLTRPDSPTILAVPDALKSQDRFRFARELRDVDNPWALLDATDDPNTVPVIADNETAQYILKLGLGKTLRITDQRGVERDLKLVATLSHSIFQSELLMSEANFVRLFPGQSGFGTVLIEANAEDAPEVQKRLNTELEGYAATVDTTAARLAAYATVANTYLSTFQTLGSLGLMLGAIGLAVVLLRGLVERRAELALLTAIGFRPGARVRLVLAENAFLLVIGLAVGAGCALLGILPTLTSGARTMNLPGLAATLAGVLAIGLAGLAVAVWVGQRRITTADLRAE